MQNPSAAEGWWFLSCLYGRCDSAHLGDRKSIPFHTTGAAYSGVSCVILTIFGCTNCTCKQLMREISEWGVNEKNIQVRLSMNRVCLNSDSLSTGNLLNMT